jgi:hypothetical protein
MFSLFKTIGDTAILLTSLHAGFAHADVIAVIDNQIGGSIELTNESCFTPAGEKTARFADALQQEKAKMITLHYLNHCGTLWLPWQIPFESAFAHPLESRRTEID